MDDKPTYLDLEDQIAKLKKQNEILIREIVSIKRNKGEEELERGGGEGLYRSFVRHSPDIIYRYSNKRGGLFWSERVIDILGFEPDEIISDPFLWNRSIHPDDINKVKEAIHNSMTGEGYSIEYRIKTRKGNYIWLLDRFMYKSQIGDEIIIEGHASDITLRKENELALTESEMRWKFAIEGNSDGLWDWDLISNKVYFSDQWKKMLGFSSDEISDCFEEWDKRVHPDDRERVYNDINRYLTGETDCYENEHRLLCKDNSYKYILDRGKIISYSIDNIPSRIIGTHSDISRRKRNEEELKRLISLLEATIESTMDGLLVVDKKGKISKYNRKFVEMWGITDTMISINDDKQLLEIVQNQLVDPDDFLNKVEQMYLGEEKSFDILHFKDGRIYERYSQPQLSEGKSVGRVWSFRDITDRVQAQNALLENQHRYKRAQALGHVGNWDYDLVSQLFWFSEESKRIFGFGMEENDFSIEQIEKYITERSRVQEAFIALVKDDDEFDLEFEIVTKKGAIKKTIHTIAEIERDSSEKPLIVRGVIQDVTEQKRAERLMIDTIATKDRFFR